MVWFVVMKRQPWHQAGDRLLTHLHESPNSWQGRAVPAAFVIWETESRFKKRR